MPCQLCPGSKKMVEAHVIPKGFFRRMEQSTETLRMLSRDSFPKRIPAGIYDKGILCEGCEPRFGQWDTYAQELLTDENGRAMPQTEGDEIVGYEISAEDWRYDHLKLFFISLVWRASVSKHSMFRRIDLGSFEGRAKAMITSGDPGCPAEFAVALTKSDPEYGRVIVDPFPERIDQISYVRFYLGLYVAFIKIDQRVGVRWLDPFVLAPGQPLRILARDYPNSRDFPVLRRLVTQPQNRRRPRSNNQ